MWRCSWLLAALLLAGCLSEKPSPTPVDGAPEATGEAQRPEWAEPASDGAEIDASDTAWLDDREVEPSPVWDGEQPPLRVETKHFTHGSTGLRDHYLIIRAQDDLLELRGLTLNRGNCPYSETDQVLNGVDWPNFLKFGQRKQVRAKCDQVIEAVVSTQYGDWTFNFD